MLEVYLGIAYFVVFIIFFSAIQFERQNLDIDFNFYQVGAALIWPFWILWYIWTKVAQNFKK